MISITDVWISGIFWEFGRRANSNTLGPPSLTYEWIAPVSVGLHWIQHEQARV